MVYLIRLMVKIACYIVAALFIIPWIFMSFWFYMIYMLYILGWTDWTDEDIEKKMYNFSWTNKLVTMKAKPNWVLEQRK